MKFIIYTDTIYTDTIYTGTIYTDTIYTDTIYTETTTQTQSTQTQFIQTQSTQTQSTQTQSIQTQPIQTQSTQTQSKQTQPILQAQSIQTQSIQTQSIQKQSIQTKYIQTQSIGCICAPYTSTPCLVCGKPTVVVSASKTRTNFKKEDLVQDNCAYWTGDNSGSGYEIILDLGCVVMIDRLELGTCTSRTGKKVFFKMQHLIFFKFKTLSFPGN